METGSKVAVGWGRLWGGAGEEWAGGGGTHLNLLVLEDAMDAAVEG